MFKSHDNAMSRSANKDRIAALMLENTFTSIPEIARILFPVRLIQCLPVWFYKNQFRSHRKACRITQPTLFLSGLSDKVKMVEDHITHDSNLTILFQYAADSAPNDE